MEFSDRSFLLDRCLHFDILYVVSYSLPGGSTGRHFKNRNNAWRQTFHYTPGICVYKHGLDGNYGSTTVASTFSLSCLRVCSFPFCLNSREEFGGRERHQS